MRVDLANRTTKHCYIPKSITSFAHTTTDLRLKINGIELNDTDTTDGYGIYSIPTDKVGAQFNETYIDSELSPIEIINTNSYPYYAKVPTDYKIFNGAELKVNITYTENGTTSTNDYEIKQDLFMTKQELSAAGITNPCGSYTVKLGTKYLSIILRAGLILLLFSDGINCKINSIQSKCLEEDFIFKNFIYNESSTENPLKIEANNTVNNFDGFNVYEKI